MMGFTHAAVGSAGAMVLAICLGNYNPETFLTASVAGALGGAIVDIDVKDHFAYPHVTDGIRTKIVVLVLIGLYFLFDYLFDFGVMNSIREQGYYALVGLIIWIALLIIGYFTPHRTFTHSFLFVGLTTACVYFVYPKLVFFYLIGCVLHLALDLLNHSFQGHGLQLLFPIKIGSGIALGWCTSKGIGNIIFFVVGILLYLVLSIMYITWIPEKNLPALLPTICVLTYVVLVFTAVGIHSEKQVL